jgi:hypothetical protein
MGGIAAIFDRNNGIPFAVLMAVSAGFVIWYAWQRKAFLFFLYSNIAGYIAITYLLFKLVENVQGGYNFFTYYFPFTCITYIIILATKKSHFAHD